MALAYQSQQNAASSAGQNLVISKPASVAAGDLLVAVLGCADATASWTTLDGFTSVIETVGATGVSMIAIKVATGSEAASFTFATNANGSGDNKIGTVMRITGARKVLASVIAASSGQANASTATCTAPTVTPTEANSMLVFVSTPFGNLTTSGYAIANNDPGGWSEIIDGSNANISQAIAYVLRSAITATGNGTATISSSANNIGQMIVISEMPTFTVSDTSTLTDSQIYSLSILVTEVISVVEVLAQAVKTIIRNVTKHVSNWINRDKSND